jgi:hypothetical protein
MLVIAAIGCDQGEGGAAATSAGSGSAVAQMPTNPGAGFSADLAKRLDGTAPATRTNANSGTTSAGSAEVKDTAAPTAAGSAAPAPAPAPAPTPPATPPQVAASEDEPEPPKQGGPPVAPTTSTPSTTPTTAPKIGGSVVISSGAATPKQPVSAELKAINIALLPNWERDVQAPGTLSLAVKIPGRTDIATFVFQYGIEDSSAPADRDAYKKWLADRKIFISKDDRQKGAAWYLEGVDRQGKPAFRMVVQYGDKKLICYGSLYKDSSLGDLRDQTIIQAKQICETLAL